MSNTPNGERRAQLLLIDDDQKLCRLLTAFLKQQGFDTSVAHDGAEGFRLAREQRWDLVILDVMLPRIDGHEVLAQLRRHSQVPVLMLTGRGAEDDLVAGLEGGADDYLPKTASSRELVTRIRALLRRAALRSPAAMPGGSVPAQIRVGALHLSTGARAVSLDGNAVALTSVEYDLLLHLVCHKGQVQSREQLLKAARNRELEAFDRAIDVHIASLRKKLGDDSRSARFIRTVRAVGYLFIDSEGGE